MRKSFWTSLIGLVVVALALVAGWQSFSWPSKSPPGELRHVVPPAAEATEGFSSIASEPSERPPPPLRSSGLDAGDTESPTASKTAGPGDAPRLDDASPKRIRLSLERAVDLAQAERPLRLEPSLIDRVAEQGVVRIVFDVNENRGLAARLAGRDGQARIDQFRYFPRLAHAAARVGPEALLELIESRVAETIELDEVHRPTLLDSLPIIGADEAHQRNFDGDGRVVAVLDSGIERTHPMFAGRIVEEACFSVLDQCPNGEREMFGPGSAVPCANAECDHGTHVTGIAVGYDPGTGLEGVAPQSELIAIQIFSVVDDEIGAYSSDILAGLQHVLGLAPFYPIDSANLSFGGTPYPSEAECDQAVSSQRLAVALLRNAGIATVAASGNDRLTNAITTPACLSNVLGVGSTNDADVVSGFSNSASFLSLLAPGQSIESAAFGGETRFSSGTSMASPHVAGAIAAIREAHPSATVAMIENALVLSGLPVLDTRNGETHPRIEVQAAIDLLDAMTLEPPPDEDVVDDPGESGGSASAASPAGGGGGGGGCGLVGLEPFLVLGLLRLGRLGRQGRRKTRPLRRRAS